MNNSKYYILESGNIYNEAVKFRKALIAAYANISEFCMRIGAAGYQLSADNSCLSKVVFPEGAVPDGFMKPDKMGATYPHKKQQLNKEWKSLTLPTPTKWMLEIVGCPQSLSYRNVDSGDHGVIGIGSFFETISIHWFSEDGDLLLIVPDVEFEVSRILAENSGKLVFENNADQWRLEDDGAREILVEEWNLIVAKYKTLQSKK